MFAAFVLAALSAGPSIQGKVREALDLQYHTESARHTLDVFSPPAMAGTRFPVAVFVHGGTWMAGDKNFFGINRNAGRMLARNGFVAVMPNYRLTPAVRHPSHAQDVARAFAWARANAAKHGGDPSRIVLLGHSAGGHLAALVATDPTYLSKEDRQALRAVVGISGVYRIPGEAEWAQMTSAVLSYWCRVNPTGMRLAGPVLSLSAPILNPFWMAFGGKEAQQNASPLRHARKGLPPFLLLFSEREPPSLDAMAMEFARALLLCGVPTEVKEFHGCNHRTIVMCLHREANPVSRAVLAFLVRHTR